MPHLAEEAGTGARLRDYVARNSARASTAKQAQSRAKMLAKMQPIAALMEDPTLSFDFPDPAEMKSPMITLEHAGARCGRLWRGAADPQAAEFPDRGR